LQKGVFEKDNLKLHLCNSVYEAYSASYLTTKHHMLHGKYCTMPRKGVWCLSIPIPVLLHC
jgi:hypothetical protein